MHVSRDVFSLRVNPEMYIGMTCPNVKLESTKTLIEKLREINKKDPEFCYMCERDWFGNVTWNFSYSVKECFEHAKQLIIEDAKEDRRRDGIPDDDIYEKVSIFKDECMCPFL